MGSSEQRALANRMAVLLAHLLKWQHNRQYAAEVGRRQ